MQIACLHHYLERASNSCISFQIIFELLGGRALPDRYKMYCCFSLLHISCHIRSIISSLGDKKW
jgi:hypothetical protein